MVIISYLIFFTVETSPPNRPRPRPHPLLSSRRPIPTHLRSTPYRGRGRFHLRLRPHRSPSRVDFRPQGQGQHGQRAAGGLGGRQLPGGGRGWYRGEDGQDAKEYYAGAGGRGGDYGAGGSRGVAHGAIFLFFSGFGANAFLFSFLAAELYYFYFYFYFCRELIMIFIRVDTWVVITKKIIIMKI